MGNLVQPSTPPSYLSAVDDLRKDRRESIREAVVTTDPTGFPEKLIFLILSYLKDERHIYLGSWSYEDEFRRTSYAHTIVYITFSKRKVAASRQKDSECDWRFEISYFHEIEPKRDQRKQRKGKKLTKLRARKVHETATGCWDVSTIVCKEYHPPRRLPCVVLQYDEHPMYKGVLFLRLILHPSDDTKSPDYLYPDELLRPHKFTHTKKKTVFHGWVKNYTDDGQAYYHKPLTGDTRWTRPLDFEECFVEPLPELVSNGFPKFSLAGQPRRPPKFLFENQPRPYSADNIFESPPVFSPDEDIQENFLLVEPNILIGREMDRGYKLSTFEEDLSLLRQRHRKTMQDQGNTSSPAAAMNALRIDHSVN